MTKRMATTLASVMALSFWACPASAQVQLTGVTGQMTTVKKDLSNTHTGKPVQKKQDKIVKDLDTIIAALEKECAACKNGIKNNNPNSPLKDSVIRSGTGGIGTLVDPSQNQKDWAKLSERERDRILQSMSEGFPPEYRIILERYYRRLAEEKTVRPDDNQSAPANTDTP